MTCEVTVLGDVGVDLVRHHPVGPEDVDHPLIVPLVVEIRVANLGKNNKFNL